MEKNPNLKSDRRRPLKGKVVFVSGGSRGIGFSIAHKFAKRGADIVFTYMRSRSDAVKAEEQLSSNGIRVLSIRANMGNESQIEDVFKQIRDKFGHLDILIHNAATGDLKPTLDLDSKEWQRTLDINLRALFLCSKLGTPLMKGRKGKIVSISSHGSKSYLPNYAAVGVAKSAMESLSRYLAVELAPKGINVNVVMAGTTDTRSLRSIPRHEEMIQLAKTKTPVGRIGHPEDISNVVLFLCSDQARWIVGQTIIADGGYSLLS